MPSDESKGSQLDAIGSLAQRQLDNTSPSASLRPLGMSQHTDTKLLICSLFQKSRVLAQDGVEWVDEPVPGYPKRPVSRGRGRREGAQETYADEPLQRPPAVARGRARGARCRRRGRVRLVPRHFRRRRPLRVAGAQRRALMASTVISRCSSETLRLMQVLSSFLFLDTTGSSFLQRDTYTSPTANSASTREIIE